MTDNNPNKNTHLALYGNLGLIRTWCGDCQCFALVINWEKQCCYNRIDDSQAAYMQRMSSPEQRRRLPPVNQRKEILQAQDHRCLYCERMFGSTVTRHHRKIRLKINWDHFVPYAYSQNNAAYNFAAACHVCNQLKSSLMFQTVHEAQIYLADKWRESDDSRADPMALLDCP